MDTGVREGVCNSLQREMSQEISQHESAMALYSASAEERDTVCCLLHFQEINERPNVTQNPVMDCLVCLQLPQSASV